jgi:hypothetical protein
LVLPTKGAYCNSMNLDPYKRLIADMQQYSLECMLLQECREDDLNNALTWSAHLSPTTAPTCWIDGLIHARKTNPALPRAPWDSMRCLVQEYWQHCYALNKETATWAWSDVFPFIIGLTIECPLRRVYLLNLMGMQTSYAKAQIEGRFNSLEQSSAFEDAIALLGTLKPQGGQCNLNPLEVGKSTT